MADLTEMTEADYKSGQYQFLGSARILVDNPLENNAPFLSDNALRIMLQEGLMKKILASAPKKATKWAPSRFQGEMILSGGSLGVNYYKEFDYNNP